MVLLFKQLQEAIDMETKSVVSGAIYSQEDSGRLINHNSCVKWTNQSLKTLNHYNPAMWYRHEAYKITHDTEIVDFPYEWRQVHRIFYNGKLCKISSYGGDTSLYTLNNNEIRRHTGNFKEGDELLVEADFKPSLIPDYGIEASDDQLTETDESVVDIDDTFERLLVLLIWKKYVTREDMAMSEEAREDFRYEMLSFKKARPPISRGGKMENRIPFGRF